jgi:DNA-binding protein H-NS
MEFKKVSQRKLSLVVQLRELTEAELNVFDSNYQEAKTIVWAEKEEKAKKVAERSEKKAKILQMMKDEGITMEEFSEGVKLNKKEKKAPVPPKYSITVDGKEITWTGRGITPKAFAEHKANNTMDQVAI